MAAQARKQPMPMPFQCHLFVLVLNTANGQRKAGINMSPPAALHTLCPDVLKSGMGHNIPASSSYECQQPVALLIGRMVRRISFPCLTRHHASWYSLRL
jgi:hypothetical protein